MGRPSALFFLVLLLALAAPAARAQQGEVVQVIAFGDSITEGYGDLNDGGGYPARLQRWLRQRGYDATVVNEGIGGESTGEGLARIDSVLAQGGDYLILMEGTNDISRRISVETIRFNLDKLAERGEAAGFRSVHASVIPRVPWAPQDASNEKTSSLAGALDALSANTGRAFADQYQLFASLPDLFETYYLDDPEDPVGHPNSLGYVEMAGLFLETMLQLLESPDLQLVAPPAPLATGAILPFQAVAGGEFTRLEWDFGDGGWAASDAPLDFEVEHVFLAPGTYTVTLTGFEADGGIAEDQATVVVEGEAPAWTTRAALLPLVLQGDGLAPEDLTADLWLQNFGAQPALVEVALFPEVHLDSPPPPRRLLLAAGGALGVERVVPTLFGLERARGTLLVTYFVAPGAPTDGLVALASLKLADDELGSSADLVEEITAARWSAAQKVVGGISGGGSTRVDLAVVNLDGAGGYVSMALYDGIGALVDSALFELEVGGVRLRGLTDLFRKLELRPQPFTAVFRASGIRFAASALLVDPIAGQVTHLESSP